MNLRTIKPGSTVKINKVSELGATPVNITSKLSSMQRKRLKIYIKEYKTQIDLVDYRDVLKLCTRLLIDEEFRPDIIGFEIEEKEISQKQTKKKKNKITGRSRLDEFAKEIVSDINSGASFVSIEKRYVIGQNALTHWRKTRTYIDNNGIVKLNEV